MKLSLFFDVLVFFFFVFGRVLHPNWEMALNSSAYLLSILSHLKKIPCFK